MDGPTPLTEPARALAQSAAEERRGEERRRRVNVQAPPEAGLVHRLTPGPHPSASGWGRQCFSTTGPGRGVEGQGPAPRSLHTGPGQRPVLTGSGSRHLRLCLLAQKQPECWALPGWGGTKFTALEGMSSILWLWSQLPTGLEGQRPALAAQFPPLSGCCVCVGGGGFTALQGGQEVSRKRESFRAVDVEGQATKLSAGARLQAPSRLQGPGQRKWGAAAGGGPWGEERQQI